METGKARTPQPEPVRLDPDEALRVAVKAAVDAGDFDRAKALLAVLEGTRPEAPNAGANVIALAARRAREGR